MISKKFVALLPTENTKERLKRIGARLGLDSSVDYKGLPTDDFEYHMTLMYSTDECDFPNFTYPTFHPIRVNGACLIKLGEKASAIRTTYSERLKILRNQIIHNMKLTHAYDDFVPHVSLSYVPNDEVEYPVPLWYCPLWFDRVVVKEID